MGRTGVGVLALATGLACAGEWQVEPWARANLEANDNIRFTSTNPEQSTGVVLEVGGKFHNDTEAVRTSLTPKLVFRRYDSSANVDSNDQYLTFSTRLLQERGEVGLSANVVRNTTLTSELEDTGIVSVGKRRTEYRLDPSYQYRLSERDSLNASVGARAIRYEEGLSSGLIDYDYRTANLTYSRRLSELLDWSGTAYYARYEAKDVDSTADTYGLRFGVSRLLSERTRMGFYVGGYRTDSRFYGAASDRSGGTTKLTLDHATELTRFNLGLSRDVVPSGGGEVREDTSLNLSANRRLSEKMSVGLSATVQQRNAIAGGSDRDYLTISPSISWRLTRQWKVSGSYRYSRQKYDVSNSTAEANAVTVGLEYRPVQINLY